MTFQGPTEQLRLIDLEPTLEPRRRTRGKAKPKPRVRRRQPSLFPPPPLKVINDDHDADPCNSGPGVCLILNCRRNLIGDITEGFTAGLSIPAVRGASQKFTLPLPTLDDDGRYVRPTWKGGRATHRLRPVTAADEDEAVQRILWRVDFLMAYVGSTCGRDVTGPMSGRRVGRVLAVEGARVQQIEAAAKRNAALAELAEQSHEDVKPWASNRARTGARRSE